MHIFKTKRPAIRAVKYAPLLKLMGVIGAAIFGLSACAPAFQSPSSPVAGKVDDTLGCQSFEDSVWSSFNASVEQNGRPPTAAELEAALKARLKTSKRLAKFSEVAKDEVSRLAADIATTINGGGIGELVKAKAVEKAAFTGSTENYELDEEARRGLWFERLAQLEIGDRTTKEKSADVDHIQEKIKKLKSIAEAEGVVGVSCAIAPPGTAPVTSSSMLDDWKSTQSLPVYGGLKTIATIYQSCEAGTHAPLGDETPDVLGIGVVARHPASGGNVRQITDKSDFLATHPYIGKSVYKRPLPNCQDVQATPSIYDFGGKPFTSTTDEKVMNLFKNAGSGSKELGIDCSALVYTAYASVGLKFKKETSLKASLVNGISSSMLQNPKPNGLSCLDHAVFTSAKSLAPGDIIAINGHVVMVSAVGPDPFGIASITSASQCRPGNISIGDFNFNIFQSDPSKGGIGVNQMRARDYLSIFSTMGQGMIDHAVNACKAKFQTTGIVSKSSRASVVRHSGTPQCIDAVPVQLTKEECLSSCSARPVPSL